MTTTEQSLACPEAIIDEYVRRGFVSIFLRPISPYGFATRTRARYDATRFLDFYRRGLDYIIRLNRNGTPIVETYTQILLRRILTPFPTGYVDLQSPAGAVTGVVAYNYDGRVYASDEARMLAAMHDDNYTVRIQMPDGYKIMPHWHPTTERVTVISGEFHAGMGDKLDENGAMTFPPGGYAVMPARMHHFAFAKGETVVQVSGMGPFTLVYVNATDDPSGMQGKKKAAPKKAAAKAGN